MQHNMVKSPSLQEAVDGIISTQINTNCPHSERSHMRKTALSPYLESFQTCSLLGNRKRNFSVDRKLKLKISPSYSAWKPLCAAVADLTSKNMSSGSIKSVKQSTAMKAFLNSRFITV